MQWGKLTLVYNASCEHFFSLKNPKHSQRMCIWLLLCTMACFLQQTCVKSHTYSCSFRPTTGDDKAVLHEAPNPKSQVTRGETTRLALCPLQHATTSFGCASSEKTKSQPHFQATLSKWGSFLLIMHHQLSVFLPWPPGSHWKPSTTHQPSLHRYRADPGEVHHRKQPNNYCFLWVSELLSWLKFGEVSGAMAIFIP
jgi:hypothetical protein